MSGRLPLMHQGLTQMAPSSMPSTSFWMSAERTRKCLALKASGHFDGQFGGVAPQQHFGKVVQQGSFWCTTMTSSSCRRMREAHGKVGGAPRARVITLSRPLRASGRASEPIHECWGLHRPEKGPMPCITMEPTRRFRGFDVCCRVQVRETCTNTFKVIRGSLQKLSASV
jgi:hypothetical protein